MRQLFGWVVGVGLVVLWAGTALGLAVPKSIFDDNGDQPVEQPDQAPPPQPQPTPDKTSPNPAPAPTPTPDTSATQPTPPATVTPAPTPHPPPQVKAPPIPVPEWDAQLASMKVIDELYKDDISRATTPALKIELAKKMMETAEGTTDDPVGKYVLLATAKDVAIASGDPPTAFACLDELAEGYRIDYVGMKLDLFAGLAKFVKSPEDQRTYVEGLNHWMDEQVSIDDYDAAKTAGELARRVAAHSQDTGLYKATMAHAKRIGEIAAAYAEVKGALDILACSSDDPASNLAAGRFYCFVKGDWKRGLPMIALGDDATLCALAKQELGGSTDADGQVAIGDGWWDAGEKETGVGQEGIRRHAVEWYQKAMPKLSGLVKEKAEKRAGELATLYPDSSETRIARNSWTNSIGMKLVRIKPETFMMGSPASDAGRGKDETQHKVTLTREFFMGTTDVTVGQFKACVNDTGFKTMAEMEGWSANVGGGGKKQGGSWRKPGFVQGDDCPVVDVTAGDSKAFCEWLSRKEGMHYRLPTEAEWEYAERVGTRVGYSFDDSIVHLGDYAWNSGNAGGKTNPVGHKKPNAWGLYDMQGNVMQWCSDWYEAYPAGAATDPTGAESGHDYVVRGAAWNDEQKSYRCGHRWSRPSWWRGNVVGFRVVLDVE